MTVQVSILIRAKTETPMKNNNINIKVFLTSYVKEANSIDYIG